MSGPEHRFQRQIKSRLTKIDGLWHFTKEAVALRGLPDIIGVYRGHFFAWELKKNVREIRRQTGRIVLQRYILEQIQKAGGTGEFVCPENFEDKLQELLRKK